MNKLLTFCMTLVIGIFVSNSAAVSKKRKNNKPKSTQPSIVATVVPSVKVNGIPTDGVSCRPLLKVKFNNAGHQIKHGKEWQCHPSGFFKLRAHWKNGIKHGPDVRYYQHGPIESLANYYNGKTHGKQSKYHPNAKIKSVRYYNQGKRCGLWQDWQSNGQLFSSSQLPACPW